MAERDRPSRIIINDFAGMATNVSPRALPPNLSQVQVNVGPYQGAGRLVTRGGLRRLRFDDLTVEPAGAEAFPAAPTSTGIKLWLRSDTGVWQDTAGTVPVALNNDPDGRMDDESGNGNNILQAVANNKPAWQTNLQNSKPGIRYDPSGTSRWLKATSAVIQVNQTLTCYLVYKAAALQDGVFFATFSSGNGDMFRLLNSAGSQAYRLLCGGTFADVLSTKSVGDVITVTIVLNAVTGTPGTATLYENGTAIGTTASLTRSASTDVNLTWGILGDLVSAPFNGWKFESLLYQGAHGATDLNTNHRYLQGRWRHY